MKKILEKDPSNKWNTIPPVPTNKVSNVNCHKFVLYITKRITWEEMVSDTNRQGESGSDFTFGEMAKNISSVSFVSIKNLESLLSLAGENIEIGKYYVGQILDAQTGEMAHSFIIQRESADNYPCFNKPGFKYAFEITNLESILNFVNKDGEKSNQNQKWRFISIDNSNQEAVKT